MFVFGYMGGGDEWILSRIEGGGRFGEIVILGDNLLSVFGWGLFFDKCMLVGVK